MLIRQIREAIAEANRKEIIERLLKGRQERVRRGLPPGGNVAYGYRRNGKGLVVEPGEAETVRMIYELTVRGQTQSGIARMLNEAGLERRNGTPWTPRQVTGILKRRAFYQEGAIQYGEVTGENRMLALVPPPHRVGVLPDAHEER